jgi:Fur family ferric uptake transcriptional regulator
MEKLMSTHAPQKQTNQTQPQRMTRQRQVILEVVRNVQTHPTADEVYEMVRLRLPRVSLGTVYRNLDRLSREGLINTIEGAGQRRYDGEMDEHVHLRCTCCDYISDVEAASIPMELPGKVVGDFEISSWQVEFLGVCGECRKARSQEPGAGSQSNHKEQGVER